MKNKIFIILLILLGVYFFTEIAIYPQKTKSLKSLAKETRSKEAKLNQIFRIDTRYTNSDGSYMGINFYSFKIRDSVLVIENISTYEITSNFIDKAAYFMGYDRFGNKLKYKGVSVKSGIDLPIIEVEFDKVDELEYLLVGGIDSSLYGENRVLYKIK